MDRPELQNGDVVDSSTQDAFVHGANDEGYAVASMFVRIKLCNLEHRTSIFHHDT